MKEKDLEQQEVIDPKGKNIRYDLPPTEHKYNLPPTHGMLVKESATRYRADHVDRTGHRIYTYHDYLNWPEDERVELIDGKIYYMASPTKTHQELLGRLFQRFSNYLQGKHCKVYFAPFDVRIDFEDRKDVIPFRKESVVQPDIVIVCDTDKLNDRGMNGVPDLIVEILSPSNVSHDTITKYRKYLAVGVKEYWIVDPETETITVNILGKGLYQPTIYFKGDIIRTTILKDFSLNVTDLFQGYQGKEVVEVEIARKEERVIAEAEVETARKEERFKAEAEMLEERAKVEAEKIEAARDMIADGLAF